MYFNFPFNYLKYILLIALVCQCETEGASDSDMRRLLKDLESYSSREVRPLQNLSDSLTIALNLKLHNILSLDYLKNVLETKVSVELVWNSHIMRWAPESYGGVKDIVLPISKIWVPDIVIYNSADNSHDLSGKLVKVYYTGYVEFSSTQILRTTCDFGQSLNGPHVCDIKFGSWTYDALAIDLQHKSGKNSSSYREVGSDVSSRSEVWDVMGIPIELDSFYDSGAYTLKNSNVINRHKYYKCCREPYADLTFTLTLERNETLFLRPTIITWILLSLCPSLNFLVGHSDRVGMSGINFLALVFFINSQNETNGKEMGKLYVFTLYVNVLAFILVLLGQWISKRKTKLPGFLQKMSKKQSKVEERSEESDWNDFSKTFNKISLGCVISISLIGMLVFLLYK